jgi:Carboxypeptidase regulatory-like domain
MDYAQERTDRIHSDDGDFCTRERLFHVQAVSPVEDTKARGKFRDPSGTAILGIEVHLLSGNDVVRHVRTDNLGAYDLGEVPWGTYKIRVQYAPKDAFCAPGIRCAAEQCTIDSTLKPNPKNMVYVE